MIAVVFQSQPLGTPSKSIKWLVSLWRWRGRPWQMRTILNGYSPPSQTEWTSLIISVSSLSHIRSMDSSGCWHLSETISAPKIPHHLHSSVQSRPSTSPDCQSRLFPANLALMSHNGLHQRMWMLSICLIPSHPLMLAQSVPVLISWHTSIGKKGD